MNIRFMAQNMLREDGIFNVRRQSAPPAWTNPANNRGAAAPPDINAAVRAAGHNIQSAINDVRGVNRDVTGRTSDADVATVTVDNARTIAAVPPRDTSIDVRQVAVAQVNRGDAVDSRAPMLAGEFSFEIEARGRTHVFNINVTDEDNNATVQQRMMAAINAADIGVTATRENVGVGDGATTRLTLTANQTGTDAAFAVRDVDGGTLASMMGVATATTEAQNAVFSINQGAERQSQTNEISLAAGVTATLTGEGRTDITFGRSAEDLVSSVTNLVGALNSAMRDVNAGAGRGNARFVSDLHGLNRTFEMSLARVGIDVLENGQLAINQNRLQAAAQDGRLERMFESNLGFAGRAGRIADNAASSRHYRNTPPPVNVTAPNTNFDFSNINNPWSMVNFFG